MSIQNVVDKILFDAKAEANAIVTAAKERSAKLLAESVSRVENSRRELEEETQRKTESILEKRAADARLACAKILLEEKRAVLDAVYALALQKLLALSKEDAVRMCDNLLCRYAETGDTVHFAENFKYAEAVMALPVCKEKGLQFAKERIAIDGGMRLIGKLADKDLSFGALLNADRDEHQASLATAIFK